MTRILAIGNNRHRQAGFSLVELMVVLVLIGLAAGAVLLTLPPASDDLDHAVTRLAARLDWAADHAVLSGEPVGLILGPQGYRFARYRLGQWQPVQDEPALAPASWPMGAVAWLEMAGGAALQADEASAEIPLLRFDPTGMAHEFRLVLAQDGARHVIAGDQAGRLAHGPDDAP
ncbi:MAG: GspH/FimT family pseudopilin [Sphingomonadales bacterium]